MAIVREKIDDHLRKTNAYQEVKTLLAEHAKAASLTEGVSERAALERLLSRTLPITATAPPLAAPTISSVALFPSTGGIASVTPRANAAAVAEVVVPGSAGAAAPVRDVLQLRVALRGGRSFTGGLVETSGGGVRWAIRAHLLFKEQRATSAAVEMAVGDPNPAVEGMFAFELCATAALPTKCEELLAMKEP